MQTTTTLIYGRSDNFTANTSNSVQSPKWSNADRVAAATPLQRLSVDELCGRRHVIHVSETTNTSSYRSAMTSWTWTALDTTDRATGVEQSSIVRLCRQGPERRRQDDNDELRRRSRWLRSKDLTGKQQRGHCRC